MKLPRILTSLLMNQYNSMNDNPLHAFILPTAGTTM